MMNHRISVLFDLTSGICLSRAFQSGEYVLSTMGMSRIMPVRTSGIACERFKHGFPGRESRDTDTRNDSKDQQWNHGHTEFEIRTPAGPLDVFEQRIAVFLDIGG